MEINNLVWLAVICALSWVVLGSLPSRLAEIGRGLGVLGVYRDRHAQSGLEKQRFGLQLRPFLVKWNPCLPARVVLAWAAAPHHQDKSNHSMSLFVFNGFDINKKP